jgi:predicted DNA binding protein
MAVIAQLRIPATSFELGRILEMESGTAIVLENLVPLGETAVPFFTVSGDAHETFEASVRDHPSVTRLDEVGRHAEERLFSLEWDATRDVFVQGVVEHGGQILDGTGSADSWQFEIRFPIHDRLSEFTEYCDDANIDLDVGRLYNPTTPGNGIWYGLTTAQRETLMAAVRGGYYAIPRRMSTTDLADRFDISDQAVTERLRRAIVTLTENTLVAAEDQAEADFDPAD